METIGNIRRRHHVGGESISAIARSLNLSRNTVKKYLNAQAEPAYRRSVQPKPQLGPFSVLIEQWLVLDAALPKARRRTARRLFEGLQAAGYHGAYDSVQRHVKAWKAAASVRGAVTHIRSGYPFADTVQRLLFAFASYGKVFASIDQSAESRYGGFNDASDDLCHLR